MMFQLIQQGNVCQKRDQNLREEVTYSDGFPGQFKDDEAMYKLVIPTNTEELETDQYDSKDQSDMFYWPSHRRRFC